MKKRYSIAPEKCECSFLHFYENAARAANHEVNDTTQYDCRKICVTRAIQDVIWKYYYDVGYSNSEISALFLMLGPKANLAGEDFVFEIEDGFIIEADQWRV